MKPGPDHYTSLKPEPIDVIRAWELPWCPANVIKYVARYRKKGGIEDLKKARHYLDIEIESQEPTIVVGSTELIARGTHPCSFRSGEWARVIGVAWADLSNRACLRVMFPDGTTDLWPVFTEPQNYELDKG